MPQSLSLTSPKFTHRLQRLDAAFLRPHRWVILSALAGMFAGSLLLLPVSLLQGWTLDRLVESTQERVGDLQSLTRIVLLALGAAIGCHLARMVLVWRGQAVMNRVSLEVVRELTDTLHRKYQRLPLAYFDREQTGQLMARITSDVGSLMIFLGSGSLQLASDLVLAAGIAVALVWLRWQLAAICFVIVPLHAVNHQFFAARFRVLSERLRSQLGAIRLSQGRLAPRRRLGRRVGWRSNRRAGPSGRSFHKLIPRLAASRRRARPRSPSGRG
ncbi:MAG TPA: ABC transporter ATP-binding protein [Gemmataceae bacterium]|nr:ABC transporter ATP-binding protein [Gemmataceae bacterium]